VKSNYYNLSNWIQTSFFHCSNYKRNETVTGLNIPKRHRFLPLTSAAASDPFLHRRRRSHLHRLFPLPPHTRAIQGTLNSAESLLFNNASRFVFISNSITHRNDFVKIEQCFRLFFADYVTCLSIMVEVRKVGSILWIIMYAAFWT